MQHFCAPADTFEVCAEKRACSKCKEMRIFPDEFHKSGNGRNGIPTFRPDCVECHRKLDRAAKRKKRAQVKDDDDDGEVQAPKARRARTLTKSESI